MMRHVLKSIQMKFKAFLGIAKTAAKAYLGTLGRFLISGNLFLFIIGIVTAIWLNSIVTPEFVLVIGLAPFSPSLVFVFYMPLFLFVLTFCVVRRFFKNLRSIWFFVGSSLMSLWSAMGSLFEVAIVWYVNNGQALPDFYIETPMPAIYTFKLFRSIFLASVFGIVGYWIEIFRKGKDANKTKNEVQKCYS